MSIGGRRRRGGEVVGDPGQGLVAAVRQGGRAARRARPEVPLLVVPADLPCLRPEDVDHVLQATAGRGAFVPDRAGTGTTLLVCPPGRRLQTRCGSGSAAAHRSLGLIRLGGAPQRARHDVDTLDDLVTAVTLGTGDATAALVRDLGIEGGQGPARSQPSAADQPVIDTTRQTSTRWKGLSAY